MSFILFLYVFAIQVNILFAVKPVRTECDRIADFKGEEKDHSLAANIVANHQVEKPLECAFKCIEHEQCKSYNYEHETAGSTHSCELLDQVKSESPSNFVSRSGFTHYESDFYSDICKTNPCASGATCVPTCSEYSCTCPENLKGFNCELYDGPPFASCKEIQNAQPSVNLPSTWLTIGEKLFQVVCDNGWTLIARFSNADNKNWMNDTGYFWYDRAEPFGNVALPDVNTDMISEAFWLVKGEEFKITQSNDVHHTSLLSTQGNCLNTNTFRAKISSYGVFKNDTVWASNACQGSCAVTYSGNYATVQGFSQSQCDGEIQSRANIGFWCDFSAGDGAVMMIGGGGTTCDRADHGIGITEANAATFLSTNTEYDFGTDAGIIPTQEYSLNLWVR